MTQPPTTPRAHQPTLLVAVLVALGIVIAGGFVVIAAGLVYVKKEAASVRHGWNPVTALVAMNDLSPGATVTTDMIGSRAFPEQFITTSVIRPESTSSILGLRLRAPLQKGDPLRWTDISGDPNVLVATHDVARGAVLTAEDFEQRSMPEEFITPSFVRINDRTHLVGRKSIAPFGKGDPILWTQLEPQQPPK